jgi:hypothetical protein
VIAPALGLCAILVLGLILVGAKRKEYPRTHG